MFKALKRVYSSANHIFKSETYANAQDDDRKADSEAFAVSGWPDKPLQFFSGNQNWPHRRRSDESPGLSSGVDRQDVASMPERCGVPPSGWLSGQSWSVVKTTPLAHTAYDLEPVPVKVAFSKEAKSAFAQFKTDQMQRCDELEQIGRLHAYPLA